MNGCVFVGAVHAIRISVTNPSLGYTLSPSPVFVGRTGEFSVGIALTGIALMSNIFIRVVETVIISVADIYSWNTVSIIASEEITKTGPLFTLAVLFGFISFRTATIVISIAIPGGGYASVVRTSKAIGRTRPLRTD